MRLASPPDVHRQRAAAHLRDAKGAIEDARAAGSCEARALRAYHASVHAALAEENAREGGETDPMSMMPPSSVKLQAANIAIEAMRLFDGCVSRGTAPRLEPLPPVQSPMFRRASAAARSRFTVIRGGR